MAAANCGAAVRVISSTKSKIEDDRHTFYKAYSGSREAGNRLTGTDGSENIIPGTQYSIMVPIGEMKEDYQLGISQLRQKNHVAESYQSFAGFLEYREERNIIEVNENAGGHSVNLILNAKEKYRLVLMWKKYWQQKFLEFINEQDLKRKNGEFHRYVINFDFVQALSLNYFGDADRAEVCMKGLIGALEIFSTVDYGCYVAMTNLPAGFIGIFRKICVTLCVKKFPKDLQLFLQESYSEGDAIQRVLLLGEDFSQAAWNSYVLSLEQGIEGFSRLECERAKTLGSVLSIDRLENPECSKMTGAMPFDVILSCGKEDDSCLFERQLEEMAEGSLDEKAVGYKINNTHMRLGSKVHIESFYEMSFLFYRTTIANRLAFMILRKIIECNQNIDLIKDPVLFYGYASYSKAVLTSLSEILQAYRSCKNSRTENLVAFASFQHNLMLESEETQMYFGLPEDGMVGKVSEDNRLVLNRKTNIIQIVPISSTLTTFEKMWKQFRESVSEEIGEAVLAASYTVFWVTDVNGRMGSGIPSDVEEGYWKDCDIKKRRVTSLMPALNNAGNPYIYYFLRSFVKWSDPLKCEQCYPDYVIEEVPLVETDPTSTVPSQQIRYKHKTGKYTPMTDSQAERFLRLEGCVVYDHISRRQNHYQFYIDTQRYFYKVKNLVRDWLEKLGTSEECVDDPMLHVIFSPEHNTNVGFAQYVNIYYFKGLAEIVSINVDKQFRSNFLCEHAALKQMIERLYIDSGRKNCPVRFYFVDDTIITGETFEKANSLLQSIVPKDVYPSNLFSKIFLLVDRMSNESKQMYVSDWKNGFQSFLHIDVSNMRTHGDSCIGCKLEQDATKMFKRSGTRNMAFYWAKKMEDYHIKEYDNRCQMQSIAKPKSYRMLVISHVIQNVIVKQERYVVMGDAYDAIVNLSLWMLGSEAEMQGNAYGFDRLLLPLKNIDGVESLFKAVCRPFFTYDFSVKRQLYIFFIYIAERMLGVDMAEILPETLREKDRIAFLFEEDGNRVIKTEHVVNLLLRRIDESDRSRLVFLCRYVLEGLTDMGSTYVMRMHTMKRMYSFVSNTRFGFSDEEQEECWKAYEVLINRLVSGNADETKELWLEYLYTTGREYRELEIEYKDRGKSEDVFRFFYTEITGNEEAAQGDKHFYQFCNNLYLQNTGINFDTIEHKVEETVSGSAHTDAYWRQMNDLSRFKNPLAGADNNVYDTQCGEELFKFLCKKGNDEDTVDKWYQELLNHVVNAITEKYHVSQINIALLARSIQDGRSTPDIEAMDIVEAKINSSKIGLAETRYCIKKRVSEAIGDTAIYDLEGNGYFMDEDLAGGGIQRPYVIAYFDNSDSTPAAHMPRPGVVRVFLYISIEKPELNGHTLHLMRMILREVMVYRNRILRCLKQDFAGDLYARYSRKNGEQNILSHEKAHSHNTTGDDRITLDVFQDKEDFGKRYHALGIEDAKDWLLLRNYTNGQIAKIFNRSFQDPKESYEGDSPMLYIPCEVQGAISNPFQYGLHKFSDLDLKNRNHHGVRDSRNELLNQVIELQYDDSLEDAEFICSEKGYCYNREYFKCILTDMLLSGVKYESKQSEFLLRIDRLLNIKNMLKNFDSEEYQPLMQDKDIQKLREKLKEERCIIHLERRQSPAEGIDYLVVSNYVNPIQFKEERNRANDRIIHRLQDPLDFADGHMSLLAIKRYIENLDKKMKAECKFRYIKKDDDRWEIYFENCLPVLKEVAQ